MEHCCTSDLGGSAITVFFTVVPKQLVTILS